MKEKEKTNILSLLDALPEDRRLDALLLTLTPLQKEILQVFLKEKASLNVFQVRKKLIERWFEMLLEEARKNTELLMKVSLDHSIVTDSLPPVTLFTKSHYPGEITIGIRALQECISKYNERESEHRKEGGKSLMGLKEKILKEVGVPVPVYSKVEHELNSMVTIGLLITIPTGERKTKSLYALDPRVCSENFYGEQIRSFSSSGRWDK